jgi:hypothetical protein
MGMLFWEVTEDPDDLLGKISEKNTSSERVFCRKLH